MGPPPGTGALAFAAVGRGAALAVDEPDEPAGRQAGPFEQTPMAAGELSHAALMALVAPDALLGVGLGDSLPLDEVFTKVELDFFERAEEIYAKGFERWEDFEPEPN